MKMCLQEKKKIHIIVKPKHSSLQSESKIILKWLGCFKYNSLLWPTVILRATCNPVCSVNELINLFRYRYIYRRTKKKKHTPKWNVMIKLLYFGMKIKMLLGNLLALFMACFTFLINRYLYIYIFIFILRIARLALLNYLFNFYSNAISLLYYIRLFPVGVIKYHVWYKPCVLSRVINVSMDGVCVCVCVWEINNRMLCNPFNHYVDTMTWESKSSI